MDEIVKLYFLLGFCATFFFAKTLWYAEHSVPIASLVAKINGVTVTGSISMTLDWSVLFSDSAQ